MNEDKELEEAIEYLKKIAKEYKTYGDLDNPEFEDIMKIPETIETVLQALKNKNTQIVFYKKLYEDLKNDFENYKNDKDINYLDGIHHKKLVEKSIGQTIDKPEECWWK